MREKGKARARNKLQLCSVLLPESFGDAAFGKALLFAGRMVFGIFLQIAMSARLGNGGDDAGSRLGFEFMQFRPQLDGSGGGHRYPGDAGNAGVDGARPVLGRQRGAVPFHLR